MLHIILYQPEIPPNTGNIIRLCANTHVFLHLIHPLGFKLDDKKMRRAGLDYHEFARIAEYESYDEFKEKNPALRIFACSTKGSNSHSVPRYQENDALLFGPETRGLPVEIRESLPTEQVIRIPMAKDSRSLNLSNAVAIILFEALRQLEYPGLA
jgi:tRNA (cytidine/uridine-2'-O-)-methyltransferase